MCTTAVATLQTIWDCKWSQLRLRLTGMPPVRQPESRWVCTRLGERQLVSEHECETCPFWEFETPTWS